ncbi:MAG TPA: hypothetical protein VFZ97_11875 [Acidimicrobiales bacterium]
MPVSSNGTSPGVRTRLLRGYGPVAALAALVVIVALSVPSKVPTKRAVSTGPGNGASSQTFQGGPSAAGSTGASGSTATGTPASGGATGSSGQAGAAGSTVNTPGKVLPCNGQTQQIPGDPYSPACVTFSGSNGGATSTGITPTAVNVAVRLTTDQSFQNTLAQLAGAQLRDTNADNQRTIQAMADYYNSHFQFYGRKIVLHFYTGQGSLGNELQGYGQAAAEADAQTDKSLGVFADLTAESEPFATALWNQHILGFGDPYMPNFWHQQHAPYDWSLATDGTKVATEAANYVLNKMCPAGTPAAYAGGSMHGAPRKIAGIAPQNELYKVSADVFHQILGPCSTGQYYYQLDLGTESQQAANLVAQLKAGGYTTIVCGCDPIFPVYLSGQAAQQGYYPEFVEIGAALVDQDYVGQLYNQQFFSHALGISPNAPTLPYTQTIGYAAYKTQRTDEPAFFVNIIYLQFDMMAIGLEMAGPNLNPQTFAQGMFNFSPRQGPAGLWGWNSSQYTIPNDVREVCWSPNTVSAYNGKMGAYINTNGNQRWTIDNIPKGAPGCPIPKS